VVRRVQRSILLAGALQSEGAFLQLWDTVHPQPAQAVEQGGHGHGVLLLDLRARPTVSVPLPWGSV
jgi:hypothetical protein